MLPEGLAASVELVRDGVLVCVLAALAWVDVRRGLLPNAVVIPAGVAGLLLSITGDPGRWFAYAASVAAVGAGLFVIAVLHPGGLGMGDVKMGAMMGAFLGPGAFLAVFVGAVSGTLVGGVLMGLGRIGRRTPLPFGAFMALGGIVALFCGDGLYDWYAGVAFGTGLDRPL